MADENESTSGSVERIDRISRLPDGIREYILGFLYIDEAVRTSLLSKDWRYTWTKADQLNINFGDEPEDYMSEDEYFSIVEDILASHVGTIRKFSVGPTWYDYRGELNGFYYLGRDMPMWLHCLSGKSIKDLTILMSSAGDGNFDMPSTIFDCLKLSLLRLEVCNLRDSVTFRGFPNLVTLALRKVHIYDDILDKILLNCPLEELHIDCCIFMNGRTAISGPHLKIFKVSYSEGDPCYLGFTPNLRVASFRLHNWELEADLWNINFFDILGRFSKIEAITLDCFLHKPLGTVIIPKTLPETCLKAVKLVHFDIRSTDHMSIMLCIMRSSPSLKDMFIDLLFLPWGLARTRKESLKAAIKNVKNMETEDIKTIITTLTVSISTIKNVKHIRAEIAFIGNILSCCPLIQKLEIHSSSDMEEYVKVKLYKALEKFGETLSKPKIIHFISYHGTLKEAPWIKDVEKEELPPHMMRVSADEIKKTQKAETDLMDLKGSMRKRMEFLDID